VDERPDTAMVDFYADYATAQISYGADDAEAAVGRLLDVVRVFERRGYVAYDPQLERVLRSDEDADAIERVVVDVRARNLALFDEPKRRGLLRRLLGR
jgi:hypothetical protein